MNAKVLTVVVGLLMLMPAGYAAGYKFGSCPSGYDCSETPDDGGPFPPHAVTGHTVFANFTIEAQANNSLGLPTDFAAVAGYIAIAEQDIIAVQRECVVWFDGTNLDQQPAGTSSDAGFDDADNSFPSDEDQAAPEDQSYQDYDFDRDVDTCAPSITNATIAPFGAFAVVVEKGDCSPEDAVAGSFVFRGHLDFTDPNGIFHEVQEYDYRCGLGSGTGTSDRGAKNALSPVVSSLFPDTRTDVHNQNGCDLYDNPTNNQDLANGDPGFVDLGHKCNGSVRDLFTERLWITTVHAPVLDPTIQTEYTFALQIDTCSGLNIYELPGKEAMGANNNYSRAQYEPGTGLDQTVSHTIDDVDRTLDAADLGLPLVEVCHDGSSFSFDDTARGRTTHDTAPATEEEIMRGNSYGFTDADGQVKHRENCRVQWIDWPYNEHPDDDPNTDDIGPDCYPEDHKTAQIDIYVFDYDPTGQFLLN